MSSLLNSLISSVSGHGGADTMAESSNVQIRSSEEAGKSCTPPLADAELLPLSPAKSL